MNVILNTQSLRTPLTGIGRYTEQLVEGFKRHNNINHLICIPNIKKNNQIIKTSNLKSNLMVIIKAIPGTYNIFNSYQNVRFKQKTSLLTSSKFIYHEPCYILKPYLGPKICTIHDLSHIHYSKYHPKERVKFLTDNLSISIDNADHIITGSNFIRNEIIDFFKISPNKITNVYHGISNSFRPRQLMQIKKTLLHYNLQEKSYLLSVCTLEPRKNLERLIFAFKQLSEQCRKKYPLVLIGVKGWHTRALEKLIQSLIKKEHLYLLGYISESDLTHLYSGAYGFVYLSVYEGFGLPLLEALASGIPTLTSNQSAMPEIVESSALLVNPFDVDQITNNLKQLINDLLLRNELKQRGLIQAAKFSWESCIDNTIKVYQKTLKSLGIS